MPEDTSRYYELAEGVVQVSPHSGTRHQRVVMLLCRQLDDQLPAGWESIHQVEVVIGPRTPATVRAPDVVLISVDRLKETPEYLNAADVVLAMEVVSPGSRRLDNVTKLNEYARAGIPYFWIIDPDGGPTLTAYELIDGDYRTVDTVTGRFDVERPFPLSINIKALVAY